MPATWTTAPPPAPGDYPASTERDPDAYRHWNGRRWSAPWYPETDGAALAASARRRACLSAERVEWLRLHHARR